MFVLISILAFFVFFLRVTSEAQWDTWSINKNLHFLLNNFFSEQQTAVAYHKFIHHSVLMSYVWLGSYMQVIESCQVIRE